MSVIILHSNTSAKAINVDVRSASIISDALSYDVEGAAFQTGFKLGTWNAKRSFAKIKTVAGAQVIYFEAGFVNLVRRSLAENGIDVSIRDMRTPLDFDRSELNLAGIEPHDYQINAIEAAIYHKRGIIRAATGSGKTEMAVGITQVIAKRTLFLTHKLDLVNQTRKRYHARMGRSVGMVSEGEFFPSDITVATVQTLLAQLKSNPERTVKFLESIEVLIVDEAHRASGDIFFRVIMSCVNAYYRIGLTATPLMKGNREDDLKLIACTGDVIYNVTNGDLIARGILAQPFFTFCEVPRFPMADGSSVSKNAYPAVYKAGIVENVARNQMILEETRFLVEKGRKVVVLVKEIKHGKLLESIFRSDGVRCVWVYGADDASERDAALQGLTDGRLDVVISSTILDEGLDCPAISAVVLAGGGKSKISLFQRVGRSVRAKKGAELEANGNTAEIIDFIDTGDRRLMRHSALRFKAVKEEDGWIVRAIIPFKERSKRFLPTAA